MYTHYVVEHDESNEDEDCILLCVREPMLKCDETIVESGDSDDEDILAPIVAPRNILPGRPSVGNNKNANFTGVIEFETDEETDEPEPAPMPIPVPEPEPEPVPELDEQVDFGMLNLSPEAVLVGFEGFLFPADLRPLSPGPDLMDMLREAELSATPVEAEAEVEAAAETEAAPEPVQVRKSARVRKVPY